ncbi:hypothetical protein B0H13DRAFT_1988941 [Mycena leptocephala]|nr:hypothetical protein B0H13DRAFT_1988941 [Mycena leptocephala]
MGRETVWVGADGVLAQFSTVGPLGTRYTAPLLLCFCGIRLRRVRPSFGATHRLRSSASPRLKVKRFACWRKAEPLTLYLTALSPTLPAAVPLLVTQSTRWCDLDLFLHHTTLAAFSNSDSDSSADRGQLHLPALCRGCLLPCSPSANADAQVSSVITAFATVLSHVSPTQRPSPPRSSCHGPSSPRSTPRACAPNTCIVVRHAPALKELRLDSDRCAAETGQVGMGVQRGHPPTPRAPAPLLFAYDPRPADAAAFLCIVFAFISAFPFSNRGRGR